MGRQSPTCLIPVVLGAVRWKPSALSLRPSGTGTRLLAHDILSQVRAVRLGRASSPARAVGCRATQTEAATLARKSCERSREGAVKDEP